ncbi:MAG: hypothetical protein IK014_01740 [Lachnospiraceae bacterium]|nr:hypothetical protein [Lachnospiraceae bacterium]
MCEYLDRIISQGESRGANEKGIKVFINCINNNMSKEQAQSIAEISDAQVEIALERMKNESCKVAQPV